MLGCECSLSQGFTFRRFFIWNKDPRDKTKIVVKFIVMNVDTLPISIVVLHNIDDVAYILSHKLIG